MVVAVDAVVADVVVEREKREGMVMTRYHRQSMIFRSGVGLLLLGLSGYAGATLAAESQPAELADYISQTDPPTFDDSDKAASAFKDAMSSSDFGKLAALLGLDAEKLKTGEGVMNTYEQIKAGAAKKVILTDAGENKIVEIGDQLWPLPFPIVKGKTASGRSTPMPGSKRSSIAALVRMSLRRSTRREPMWTRRKNTLKKITTAMACSNMPRS